MAHSDLISPKVRTVTYFVLLGAAAITLGVEGVASIWLTDQLAAQVADTASVLLSVVALIAGGLGVTYRPTRNGRETSTQAPIQTRYELGD